MEWSYLCEPDRRATPARKGGRSKSAADALDSASPKLERRQSEPTVLKRTPRQGENVRPAHVLSLVGEDETEEEILSKDTSTRHLTRAPTTATPADLRLRRSQSDSMDSSSTLNDVPLQSPRSTSRDIDLRTPRSNGPGSDLLTTSTPRSAQQKKSPTPRSRSVDSQHHPVAPSRFHFNESTPAQSSPLATDFPPPPSATSVFEESTPASEQDSEAPSSVLSDIDAAQAEIENLLRLVDPPPPHNPADSTVEAASKQPPIITDLDDDLGDLESLIVPPPPAFKTDADVEV